MVELFAVVDGMSPFKWMLLFAKRLTLMNKLPGLMEEEGASASTAYRYTCPQKDVLTREAADL